ncbi:MAG: ketoacyl-ACP synthase III [Rhodospirillales bacterium]|nr:ketoacyl-ACP synthase III [Alphaproteobacteria bacterium]MCB9987180.1 ketoacyl-ACP synthase III [Rhodospirillales bacterium]USO07957.1 MAG: ketoacyl-ACP synthase III [Rhodospirillales bacterium]
MKRARILSTGAYLPARVMTNADLEKMVDTSDEKIVQLTGIRERRIAAEGELTSHMALEAARKALVHARLTPADIDAVIVATTTPDDTFPATAVKVQAGLGMTHGFAFDVQAVCSGFIYALATANAMIASGQIRRAIVIGAEKMSSIIDWHDRNTCILFGDGAGAAVVEATEDAKAGIIGVHLHSDGRFRDMLYTDGGPASTGRAGVIRMQGREVFKHAVEALAQVVDEALEASGCQPSDIDLLVPHQANVRIIEGTAKKLGLPMEKVVLTLERQGNTSAASIPLALDSAIGAGRAKRGDLLLLEAMGGGFTWGSVLLRW